MNARTRAERERVWRGRAGAYLGALVPVLVYAVAHEAQARGFAGALAAVAWLLVCAGLLWSAPTVYGWALPAFGARVKAFGFVALLEGNLVAAHYLGLPWVAGVALLTLAGINAIATRARFAQKGRMR